MYPSSPDICCRDSTMGQAQPVLQPSNTQCQPLASCVPSSQAPHGHSIQPGQSRQPGTSQQHCIFSQENSQGPAGKDNHRAMCLPTVASSGTSHGKTPIRKAVRGKKWCRRTPKKQGYFSHSSLCEGEAHLHTWFKFHSADSFPCSKTQQRTDVLLPHIHQSTSLPYPELCFPTADVGCAATGAALLEAICSNNLQERALEGSAPPGDTAAKRCPDSAKPHCCCAKKKQLNMQQHTQMMLKRLGLIFLTAWKSH